MKKIVTDILELSILDKEKITNEIKNSEEYCLELLYKSDFSTTSAIRSFVAFLCDQLGIDASTKFKIILIADELNNNAIEYGSLKGDVNKMRILLSKKGKTRELTVEVEDTGKGKYHKGAKEMQKLQSEKILKGFRDYSSIRGRGLFLIITNLVNKLYFKDAETGGLIVGIKKSI
nr:ATP-binding protein [Candidatus Gracilibacteria bacterium]